MSQWTPLIKKSERGQQPMPSVCVTCPIDQLIAYFSDWRGLKTAVAWLLRLKAMLLGRSHQWKHLEAAMVGNPVETLVPRSCILKLAELLKAEVAIIPFCQQRFSEEICGLSSKKATVSRQSPLYRLDPVLKEAKHPLDRLQIAACFYAYLQTSTSESKPLWANSLSTVRRIFWINNACSAVRKIIVVCSFLRCYSGRAVEQKIADLPTARILSDLPQFTNTEVDKLKWGKGRSTCRL